MSNCKYDSRQHSAELCAFCKNPNMTVVEVIEMKISEVSGYLEEATNQEHVDLLNHDLRTLRRELRKAKVGA
jgi:hypothetical protein